MHSIGQIVRLEGADHSYIEGGVPSSITVIVVVAKDEGLFLPPSILKV